MSSSSNSSPEIDKDQLYGEFQERQQWQDKLFRKGAHKALDIPDDDMNINVNKKSGFGWKELLVVGTVGIAGLLGWRGLDRLSEPATEPPAAVPSVAPLADAQSFRVRFRAEDGTEIKVEPEK